MAPYVNTKVYIKQSLSGTYKCYIRYILVLASSVQLTLCFHKLNKTRVLLNTETNKKYV